MAATRHGVRWSREEAILVLELYCRIPFQQSTANNPAVRELADLLGRTPGSIAMKLGNFGAFDPTLRSKNIRGLAHASRLDREVWERFHADWNGLAWEAEALRKERSGASEEVEFAPPSGPSEKIALAKRRVHQSFFRDAVLSSYESACCVTGLPIRECLIASHIVPWSKSEQFRADPTNGLCLSATFDRLFEAGLMTVTENLRVQLSSRIAGLRGEAFRDLIYRYNDQPIAKPMRFTPSAERLEWHRLHRFQR